MAAGWIEQKRQYRQYKARVAALPANYREAEEALERYMTYLGSWRADSLMSMLNDLADLFEQSAADGTPVRDVVGDDPVEFATEFIQNYPEGQWIIRERDRLNTAIIRASGEGSTNANERSL